MIICLLSLGPHPLPAPPGGDQHDGMIIFRSCWGIFTLFLQLLACDPVATSKYIPPRPNPHLPLDKLPDARPPSHDRLFTSKLVEDELDRVSAEIKDEALRKIWQNAYPNTLDTTVSWHDADRQTPLGSAFPRTFLVTGDITASWLRDSTSQMVGQNLFAKGFS